MQPEMCRRADPARVLVVEDEALIRALLAEELRAAGVAVIEATNADEAVAWLEAGEPVDLVFTDIRMPGSLDGLQLAARLRDRRPDLPVILTSGSFTDDLTRALGVFVPKPYDLRRTVAQVVAMLEQGRSASA